MKFTFDHFNINVLDLEKSVKFYKESLNLVEVNRFEAKDGSFTLVYLGDGESGHRLELTWLRDRKTPYNLGDNEFHMALVVDNYEEAYERHKKMGSIAYENSVMGIYFIVDPDGYWVEILPKK